MFNIACIWNKLFSIMETGNVSNSSSDTNSKTDLSTEESLKVLMFNTDSFFLVIMGIVVFLMQVGFSFLEAGAVRYNIFYQLVQVMYLNGRVNFKV